MVRLLIPLKNVPLISSPWTLTRTLWRFDYLLAPAEEQKEGTAPTQSTAGRDAPDIHVLCSRDSRSPATGHSRTHNWAQPRSPRPREDPLCFATLPELAVFLPDGSPIPIKRSHSAFPSIDPIIRAPQKFGVPSSNRRPSNWSSWCRKTSQ
jgi:hypothetical protein